MPKRELSLKEILAWADAFHARRGRYPNQYDGPVGQPGVTTWSAVSQALRKGQRGLPGGSTLAYLLRDLRGVRHRTYPPRLTIAQILRWVGAYYREHGEWPKHESGVIPGTQQETWLAVESALRDGSRGLKGGASLARLLEARRGVRNRMALAPLSHAQILAWADRHHVRTGCWPVSASGPVAGSRVETWDAVDACLQLGHRQLPPGGSLARLLAEHRGVRNSHAPPRLSVEQILTWADAHKARGGAWPTEDSGPIADAPDETWGAVNAALIAGNRGLPGGDTVARLLARCRGKRNPAALPRLTIGQIRAWGKAHHARCGVWPTRRSGAIPEAPGETWMAVGKALERGRRGLPHGLSLARLFRRLSC